MNIAEAAEKSSGCRPSAAASATPHDWAPFHADAESGIGRQLIVGDVNGDKLPDIIVGGMKGSHVLIHRRKSVSRAEWEQAQPSPRDAAGSP